MSRSLYIIPFQDKFLIYRPLRRLIFIGNAAMADCARDWCDHGIMPEDEGTKAFLSQCGFFEKDPQYCCKGCRDISKFTPTNATLLMTNRCSLRCIYCYADGGEANSDDLPLEYGYQAIDSACENARLIGEKEFSVTFHGGGEPTLPWENLCKFAEYARSKPLPCNLSMVSNGFWSEDRAREIMKMLDYLTLSMDGNEEVQNRQRPAPGSRPSFPVVMRSVRMLSEAKFPFTIRMTVTPDGFSRLPEDVRFFCENSACTLIHAEPAFNTARGGHSAAAVQESLAFAEAYLDACDVAASYGRQLYYSGADIANVKDVFCQAPVGGCFTVNPHGEITGCYETTGRESQPDAVFGILDKDGIHIDREQRLKFMSKIIARRDRCEDCFCYYHCAGDCFTRGFPNPKGSEWPYSRCIVNRAITLGLLLRAMEEKKEG